MMRSYLLKGRLTATEDDKMILCPTAKMNCCVHRDEQRIYHIVNDILPPRLLDYEEKVKTALSRLRNFHLHITNVTHTFEGSDRRQHYCVQQARTVAEFPFETLYDEILESLEGVNFEMRQYYQRFFCVLCDGRNHPFFDIDGKTKRLTFDAAFCQETIQNFGEIINALNIQLVTYLVALQNLVDCKHYVKSYNLRFFASSRIKSTVDLIECLDVIKSKEFVKKCKNTCAKLSLARVVFFMGQVRWGQVVMEKRIILVGTIFQRGDLLKVSGNKNVSGLRDT